MSCIPGPYLVSGVQELMGPFLTNHSSCKQLQNYERWLLLKDIHIPEQAAKQHPQPPAIREVRSTREYSGTSSQLGIKQVAGLPMLSSTTVEKVVWRRCVGSLPQAQVGEKGGSMQALVGKAGKQAILIAW